MEKYKKQTFINRYEKLLLFNNRMMDRILKHRDMLEEVGQDPKELPWCYSDYDECYYRKDDMYNCKTKADYIEACKEIEKGIAVMSGVDDRTIMAVRTYIPINFCTDCDKRVTGKYSFRSENRKPMCSECGKQNMEFNNLSKVNVIVRYNNTIHKCIRNVQEIKESIHSMDFVEANHDHRMDNILKHNIFGKLAPRENGLVVIDYENNTIINLCTDLMAGAIKKGEETVELQRFYDKGRVMLDKIDYMLDLRPFTVDTYNSAFKSDSELVFKKLQELGFKFTDDDLKQWETWYKRYQL